ncbi:MAG: hypothetical protein RLY78_2546, partial [Pseudomonadota bacterium]
MKMNADKGLLWLRQALGLPAGAEPFPWQRRLLAQWLEGRAPRAMDLPTGLGKTSVMAIWLVARALGARLPRRLVYVVDRRAVVDQATAVAESLRQCVAADPELKKALGLAGDLPISTLRGQFVDNRQWLVDPAAPAIVIGTVDMVGSRLLFSGYGVSRKMRPYHAGLLGADAMVVLDEAHLVPPFERLLDQVVHRQQADQRGARDAAATAVPSMQLLTLSATGRSRSASETFTLDAEDQAHPVVRQRLQASKSIRLMRSVESKLLPDTLALEAWSLLAEGRKAGRILVFVNSRNQARKVEAALIKQAGKHPTFQCELFVGGRRVHEREAAAERLTTLGFVAGSADVASVPAVVVATAAGEVGVDLDASDAVADIVAWERMVQRLGRVNRRGLGQASVMLVPVSDPAEEVAPRHAASLALLERLPRTLDAALDGSPAALVALKQQPDVADLLIAASTPAPLYPPLKRAVVDAWAMTSLDVHTGRPEVAPWLRGWPDEEEEPQVAVIWRRHLPIDDEGHLFRSAHLELFLDAAGSHLSERLEADLSDVQEWLIKRVKSLATVRGKAEPEAEPILCQSDVVAVTIGEAASRAWTGQQLLSANRRELETVLMTGTLWVDRRLGGLSSGLLDVGCSEPAQDVSEALRPDGSRVLPVWIQRVDAA